jgi:hypothetical protein
MLQFIEQSALRSAARNSSPKSFTGIVERVLY